MARPKAQGIRKLLPEIDPRTEKIVVWVSPAEADLVRQMADRVGAPVSAFIRTATIKAAERVAEAAIRRRDRLQGLLDELRALEEIEAEIEERTD